ncbi:MAG: hypothetical protein C0601_11150 [Candidatus Muiribacterium halophilum]|uniref:N-acetyltransferase domain-containing protein n=1 Tax=Muiribacterium halophilum TaxID=2053465 RepID=A0A2N5ZBW9_MUIH1|nr:MAG: hypothetical protein C0601_11150 [Candidatus Muirbacterium halophilum]
MEKFSPVTLEYEGRDFILRTAKVEDCPDIMDLYNTIYRGYYTIDFCTNAQAYIEAMEDSSIFWLVLENKKRIVSSVFFKINSDCRIAKVMGAAVRPEFRGLSLMQDMAHIGTEFCLYRSDYVDLIYSTTRTNQPAPQKILQNIGYKCIGILPNVVKVKQFETHSIMVIYRKGVLKNKQTELNLLQEVIPFFNIVKDNIDIKDEPGIIELAEKKKLKLRQIPFEAIYNPKKAAKLFEQRMQERNFTDRFFLTKPNLVLYNQELNIEVFLKWIDEEKQANIIWLNYENRNWYNILNSITNFCYQLNIRYFEILIDAWDSKKQKAAMDAKFVPSAYFPSLFLNEETGKRKDAVVFIRSFEILDFSELITLGIATDFLKEFYKSWEKIYIGNFFKNLDK